MAAPRRTLGVLLLFAALAALAPGGASAEDAAALIPPYEGRAGFEPVNAIDVAVLAELRRRGIQPSHRCSDEVFIRRVHIDVIGTLPDPRRVAAFLGDESEDKRARLVDEVLAREEYADLWTLKWCDLLRVKAEFPINLWPNGVQAYRRWIFEQIKANLPYDEFVRTLLTSSGSNFRVAPVNFYRATQDRSGEGLAAAVALTFMGTRFERWPKPKQQGMAAFFSHVAFKKTAEWKEEIVIPDPAPRGPLAASFPDGTKTVVAPDEDPRRAFASWLVNEKNPWFARNLANRAWSWLMGRGVVHEPDDLREDNPPVNAALLAALERAFIASDFDVKALFRLILNSRTYQGSPIAQSKDPQAEALFAHYALRRLDAEVLIDALCRLDGRGENYLSQVPEPFTILRGLTRTVRLADGSITSPFLEMFGRPSRDTGMESERNNEPTDAQRLYLLNSTDVHRRLVGSRWLRRLVQRYRQKPTTLARYIYLTLLSRQPMPLELGIAVQHIRAKPRNPHEPAVDVAWALINTKEFLYRH
ncbi:MAG: DUF1553 domain-containing protein [Planctomycetota bacterium]|nr:DUF1553 domain-containing protein [Planctomycetota bacterium]